jgi:hypothetical protein
MALLVGLEASRCLDGPLKADDAEELMTALRTARQAYGDRRSADYLAAKAKAEVTAAQPKKQTAAQLKSRKRAALTARLEEVQGDAEAQLAFIDGAAWQLARLKPNQDDEEVDA